MQSTPTCLSESECSPHGTMSNPHFTPLKTINSHNTTRIRILITKHLRGISIHLLHKPLIIHLVVLRLVIVKIVLPHLHFRIILRLAGRRRCFSGDFFFAFLGFIIFVPFLGLILVAAFLRFLLVFRLLLDRFLFRLDFDDRSMLSGPLVDVIGEVLRFENAFYCDL